MRKKEHDAFLITMAKNMVYIFINLDMKKVR